MPTRNQSIERFVRLLQQYIVFLRNSGFSERQILNEFRRLDPQARQVVRELLNRPRTPYTQRVMIGTTIRRTNTPRRSN
jgi:hypothetical protein